MKTKTVCLICSCTEWQYVTKCW